MLAKVRRFDTVAVMFSLSASKRVNGVFAELGQITLLAREAAASLLKGGPRGAICSTRFITSA